MIKVQIVSNADSAAAIVTPYLVGSIPIFFLRISSANVLLCIRTYTMDRAHRIHEIGGRDSSTCLDPIRTLA